MRIGWEHKLFTAGWVVPAVRAGERQSLRWSRVRLWRLPRDVHAPNTARRFLSLLQSSPPFRAWWARVGQGKTAQALELEFPPGAWEVPWELLVNPPRAKDEPDVFGPTDPALLS